MDFSICWAMTTRTTAMREKMERLERKILKRLAVPDPYARDLNRTMPDADAPSRPAEPAGSIRSATFRCRSAAADAESDGFFARLARALFGWKNGPTRADIEVVLEAAGPAKPASRRKSAP